MLSCDKFKSGGTELILTWFAFGLAALLFSNSKCKYPEFGIAGCWLLVVPASLMLHYVVNDLPTQRRDLPYLSIATLMGALSGVLPAMGLMRWVFVVPVLANLYTAPTTSTTVREAVSVVYLAVHQYGGVVIGEHLGQTLLVGWTLGVGWATRSPTRFRAWVAWWGWFTAPLLRLGKSELLATVIPQMPVLETTPIGFTLWELWLLVVGISLLRVPQKRLMPKPEAG